MDDYESEQELLAKLRELAAKEKRYRAYFEDAPCAIYVMDAAGRYVDANPAALRQIGYTKRELLDLSVVDIATQPAAGESLEALRRDGEVSVETTLHRKDGQTLMAALEAVALDGEQNYLAFVKDITKTKEQERNLRQARDRAQRYLDTVGAMVVVLDKTGRITLINRQGCHLLGYREEELLGQFWFATCLPQPSGLEKLYPSFQQAINGETIPPEKVESPVVTKEGNLRHLAWHSKLLYDDQGHVTGILSAGEDISEKRRLEQQLQQAQKMEGLGTLAGGLAHDMNNVLAMVLGFASAAKSELPSNHPVRKDLSDIIEAGERGKSLVQNLLGFAQKGQYQKQNLSLNDIVEKLVSVLKQSLPKDVDVAADLDPELGEVLGDSPQISQTLMNLCINSADALGSSGVIMIRTRNEEIVQSQMTHLCPGRYARVEIEDNGPGMRDEVREKAFEPFFTTKEIGKGTGLGLSMAYGVIRNHQGTIELDSAPGAGTKVTLWLPTAQSKPKVSSSPPARAARNPASRSTVLVVDDEQQVRKSLCRMLDRLGYLALSADGGDSALQLYRERKDDIDLVILDLSMPKMNGLECFSALQALDPTVRVLLCTGHGDEAAVDQMIQNGILGVARKPFGLDELRRFINDALAPSHHPQRT